MDGQGDTPDTGFEPAPSRVLSDLEELRVVTHPLRRRIIDCLIPSEHTVKEIGRLLGVGSNTLYYHVGELERIGLVRRTRIGLKAGIQQSHYRATARYYHLAANLLDPNGGERRDDVGADFVAGAVEDGARYLRETFAAGAIDNRLDVVLVGRRTARLSAERAAQFRERLSALVRDFVAADQGDGEQRMEVVYALFPRVAADPSVDGEGAALGRVVDGRRG